MNNLHKIIPAGREQLELFLQKLDERGVDLVKLKEEPWFVGLIYILENASEFQAFVIRDSIIAAKASEARTISRDYLQLPYPRTYIELKYKHGPDWDMPTGIFFTELDFGASRVLAAQAFTQLPPGQEESGKWIFEPHMSVLRETTEEEKAEGRGIVSVGSCAPPPWALSAVGMEPSQIANLRSSGMTHCQDYFALLHSFNEVLSCNNIYVKKLRAPGKWNKSRKKKGELPIVDTRTLCVRVSDEQKVISDYDQKGSHASPRRHFRRGHVRHLRSGKATWVTQCMVGAAEDGVVAKDYEL